MPCTSLMLRSPILRALPLINLKLSSRGLALFMGAALLGSPAGCKKYQEKIANQKDEIAALEIDKAELIAERKALEEKQDELDAKIAEVDAANQELDARIASLIEYQKALEKQLDELGIDKSKIAMQFKTAQANLEAQQKVIDEMQRQQLLAKKRLDILKNMLKKFKNLIAGGKLKVRVRNGKLMLELPSAILFESGKADLSTGGQQTLSEVAKVLATISSREFQVAGHTDNVPISNAKFPSNWELSTSRSVSVVKFLQDKGVDPNWLSAAGYSKYQPTATNNTAEGKSKNRRIEITLMPNLDELPDLSELEEELKK